MPSWGYMPVNQEKCYKKQGRFTLWNVYNNFSACDKTWENIYELPTL